MYWILIRIAYDGKC